MSSRFDMRAAALLAPAAIGGIVAVSVASAVDPVAVRIALQGGAILAVVAIVWRTATLVRDSAAAHVMMEPAELRVVAHDRRRPIFDRETGAYSAWYFRLRVEEEMARADRFGEKFTVLSISWSGEATIDLETIAAKTWLREVDFAGNVGSSIAVTLPHTNREGAAILVERIAPMLEQVDVRICEYPTEARTFDALIGADQWQSSQAGGDIVA